MASRRETEACPRAFERQRLGLPASGHVEQPHAIGLVGDGQRALIGVEIKRHTVGRVRFGVGREKAQAVGKPPDNDVAVSESSTQQLPIRAESDFDDRFGGPLKFDNWLVRGKERDRDGPSRVADGVRVEVGRKRQRIAGLNGYRH